MNKAWFSRLPLRMDALTGSLPSYQYFIGHDLNDAFGFIALRNNGEFRVKFFRMSPSGIYGRFPDKDRFP